MYAALNYCVHKYVNDLEFFRFSLHNAHRLFFSFNECFCTDNARVIDGKIGYFLSDLHTSHECTYISFIHLLRVSYNFDTCVHYRSFYIFFISEWPRSFNFIIALSFLVSFGEVKIL
jgi:hypothetical protein